MTTATLLKRAAYRAWKVALALITVGSAAAFLLSFLALIGSNLAGTAVFIYRLCFLPQFLFSDYYRDALFPFVIAVRPQSIFYFSSVEFLYAYVLATLSIFVWPASNLPTSE